MAKVRKIRQQRKTLLVVGEGATEEAFLKYLRSLYCSGKKGPKVTIKNAYGKGPEHVLDVAVRSQRGVAYDQVATFLDTDIPWSKELKARAKEYKIELIGNTPCIEGMLLQLLGKRVPALSVDCKKQLSAALDYNPLNAGEYEQWCTLELLDRLAAQDEHLYKLLSFYQV